MEEKCSCSQIAQTGIRTEVHLVGTTLIRLGSGTLADLTLEVLMPDLIPRIYFTFIFIIEQRSLLPSKIFQFFPLFWEEFTFVSGNARSHCFKYP